MIVYVVLFLLEALILGGCVLIGYKRGAGKELVRLVELVVAAVAAFFLGKWVAAMISDEVFGVVLSMLDGPVREMVDLAPTTQQLVKGLIGSLLSPLIFAVIFVLLQLLSLIGLSAFAKRLFPGLYSEELSNKMKWIGAGLGAVCGVIVALACLSPWYADATILASIPVETEEMLALELGLDKNTFAALPHNDITPPLSSMFAKSITTFRVDGEKFTGVKETPHLVNLVTDVLHTFNESRKNGDDAIVSVAAAVSATVEHLQESKYTAHLTVGIVNVVGESIRTGKDILGISGNQDQGMDQGIVKTIGEVLTGVSVDNVVDNVIALVGDKKSGTTGVLQAVASVVVETDDTDDTDDTSTDAATKKEDKLQNLADSFMQVAKNPKLSSTMKAITKTGARMLSERIPEKGDERRDDYIEKLSEGVNEVLVATESSKDDFETSVSIAQDVIKDKVSQMEDLEVTDGELRILAICAVDYFGTAENYSQAGSAPVTMADIEAFFTANQ